MKQIKLFIIIVVIFSVFSCRKELVNDDYFVRNLSNDVNFDLPLQNESLMIFINNNNTIYVTSLRELNSIKKNKYNNYKNFDDFLIEVLNNNLLSKSDLINNSVFRFKLNNVILNEFAEKGLDKLKNKYCENTETKDKFYLKNSLNSDVKKNIMYLFFKKNYYIMQNDYSGKYVLIDKNLKRGNMGMYQN